MTFIAVSAEQPLNAPEEIFATDVGIVTHVSSVHPVNAQAAILFTGLPPSEDGTITNIEFIGGCNGNLKAIAKLVDGMKAEEIYAKLHGNTCGRNTTSCADQLAIAVMEA